MNVDVIIPNCNQAPALAQVLHGFSKQVTDHSIHIYIIDDGSTENLYDYVSEELIQSLSLNIIRNERNLGRAISRNLASRLGNSELIIFNDSDRIPDAQFINEHVRSYRKFIEQDVVVAGHPKEIYSQHNETIWKIVTEKQRLARQTIFTKNVLAIYDNDGLSDSFLPWLSTFSGNMSLKRTLFERYYFDEGFTRWGFENIELGYRMFRDDISFVFNQQAVNYHLAHKRNENFYRDGIEWSIQYMSDKYKQPDIMSLLKDYMFGKLSLQQLELSIGNSDARWLKQQAEPLMNVIHQ